MSKNLLEQIRKAPPETIDVPYRGVDITIKRFQPGTAARKRETALIKLHQNRKTNDILPSEMTDEEFAEFISTQKERRTELDTEFSEIVIDKETGENYVSVEDAREYFDNQFKDNCITWAMGGAFPPDEDNLTEEEEFPSVSDGS